MSKAWVRDRMASKRPNLKGQNMSKAWVWGGMASKRPNLKGQNMSKAKGVSIFADWGQHALE